MQYFKKIFIFLVLALLSILFRCLSTPFLGMYLDKTSIYLAALLLGFWWTIIQAASIISLHIIVINDPIALLRLPAYIIFAFIVGGLTDIMVRKKVFRGFIEFSWFLNCVLIGLILQLYFGSLIGIALLTAFILLGILFLISYKVQVPKISKGVRHTYSAVILYALTPLTYMLMEFDMYALTMFNFLAPSTLPYTDIPRAVISYGGDALLSMLITLALYIALIKIKQEFPQITELKRTIISLLLILCLLLPVVLSAHHFYESREDALSLIVPRDAHPWELTIVKMDYVWLPLGAHGTNYYYLVPGERGNPNSKYYQAWFGVYWVDGKWYSEEDISIVKDAIYKFAIIDQNFWLAQHGDPNPYTAVKSEEEFKRYEVNGIEGWLMIGSMYTHSDVAEEGYKNISIKGFFFVAYFPEYDKTAIVYACTSEEYYDTNKDGIRDELFNLLHQIVFPIGS